MRLDEIGQQAISRLTVGWALCVSILVVIFCAAPAVLTPF